MYIWETPGSNLLQPLVLSRFLCVLYPKYRSIDLSSQVLLILPHSDFCSYQILNHVSVLRGKLPIRRDTIPFVSLVTARIHEFFIRHSHLERSRPINSTMSCCVIVSSFKSLSAMSSTACFLSVSIVLARS